MGAKFSSSLFVPTAGSSTQLQPVGYAGLSGFQDLLLRNLVISTSILPTSDNVGNIGNPTTRWANIRATVVTSGDLGFDDAGCAFCKKSFQKGERLHLVVTSARDDAAGKDWCNTVPVHVGCEE